MLADELLQFVDYIESMMRQENVPFSLSKMNLAFLLAVQ